MRDLTILLVHLITTVIRITPPGGLRSVVAESVLIKHQLLICGIRNQLVERGPRIPERFRLRESASSIGSSRLPPSQTLSRDQSRAPYFAVRRDLHVSGFEISMHHAQFVRGLQCFSDLLRDV